MQIISHIFLYNIIPLTIMIGVGILLQRAFKLDLRTLSKLSFYLFSPSILFVLLYETELSAEIAGKVLLFFFIFYTILVIVTEICIRMKGLQGGKRGAMRNSVIFYNSANYAIPLNQLVFANNPFTMAIQLIVMVFQSILPNTLGIYSINAHKMTIREATKTILSFPAIYVVPLAIVMKIFHVPVPEPVYIPLKYVADAFVATALITLGAQLGAMKWKFSISDVVLSNTLRLLISPAIGFVIVWALGYDGLMAQALVLSCAVPSSLVSVLLAVEFDNEQDFASQTVFSSTLLSIVTVTGVIYLIQWL